MMPYSTRHLIHHPLSHPLIYPYLQYIDDGAGMLHLSPTSICQLYVLTRRLTNSRIFRTTAKREISKMQEKEKQTYSSLSCQLSITARQLHLAPYQHSAPCHHHSSTHIIHKLSSPVFTRG